jgi:hypothetical protein
MIKINTIRLTKKTGHISCEMYLNRVNLNGKRLSIKVYARRRVQGIRLKILISP